MSHRTLSHCVIPFVTEHRWDEEADKFQRYIYSFYFTLTTMTTVGYGDMSAQNFEDISANICTQTHRTCSHCYVVIKQYLSNSWHHPFLLWCAIVKQTRRPSLCLCCSLSPRWSTQALGISQKGASPGAGQTRLARRVVFARSPRPARRKIPEQAKGSRGPGPL